MTENKPYRCSNCGKPAKRLFKGALCRSCATPTWKCRECGREYKYYTEIGKCRRCRAKGQTFTCGLCGRSFVTRKGLMQHEESHSQSFVCPKCGLECGTPQAYGSHMAYHDPAKVEQKNAKTRETCLERYGVTAPWSSKQAIEKARRTKIEKYGYYTKFEHDRDWLSRMVRERAWSPEARRKRVETNIGRYGGKTPMSDDDVKRKYKASNMRKYGVPSPTMLPEVKAKREQTMLERFGVSHPMQSDDMRRRVRDAHFAKYGGWAFNQPKSIMNMRRTYLSKSSKLDDEQIGMVTSRNGMIELIQSFGDNKPSISELSCATGISHRVLDTSIKEFDLGDMCDMTPIASGPNKYWNRILTDNGIGFLTEQRVYGDGRRCDFLVENIAVEINPTHTHASYGAFTFRERHTPMTYHRDKSIAALRNGYQPLCVWDWDDPSDIVSLIRSVLDGSYETDPEYIPLDRPVIGIPIGELDLESVEPNLVWCDKDGNVVDETDDDVDANVSNGLFGIYDCGTVHASN